MSKNKKAAMQRLPSETIASSEALLTAQQASKFLNISRITFYRLAEQGQIPAVKIGSSWRVSPKVLKEFVERGGFPVEDN